jgi:very-short-patch-repair endonuclease
MGPYIADFVSHSHRLVIEVDGESHDFESRQQSDARRDAWFTNGGYRVLRFSNDDVLKKLEGVVGAISDVALWAEGPPLPVPPPQGGGNEDGKAGAI